MNTNEKSFEDLPLSDSAFDALFKTPQLHSTDEQDAAGTGDEPEDES